MITKTLSNFVLALIVFIWVVPFVALVSTSLRSETEAKTAGFWTAFTPTELGHRFSTHDKGQQTKVIDMRGNIFERIHKNKAWFTLSGEIKSIMFKCRVPDPDKPGKSKLIRTLVPAVDVLAVRGGDFSFHANGDFLWSFP